MRVGCRRPIWFPSGSVAIAMYPTFGICCFGMIIFPPSFLTFSIDWSMFSSEM